MGRQAAVCSPELLCRSVEGGRGGGARCPAQRQHPEAPVAVEPAGLNCVIRRGPVFRNRVHILLRLRPVTLSLR